MQWGDLWGLAVLARREYQASCRGAAFWLLAAAGSALAVWRSAAPGTSAALAAYQGLQVVLLGVGVVGILMAGAAAARDRRQEALELILAKPAGSAAGLPVVRFAAIWGVMLTIGAIILAGAAVGQGLIAGTAWQPSAYGDALIRCAVPLGLASALGFSLSTLFSTPLAAAVAAIYWIAIPLTRAYMPMALDWMLPQHWTLSALLASGLVALAAALYARGTRPARGSAVVAGVLAAVLLASAGGAAFAIASSGEDALMKPDPILMAIAGQTTVPGERAPGFWLPDSRGRLVGMSDVAGRPVVLAFWGPAAPASARSLEMVGDLSNRFAAEGLACVAVCLDRDAAAAKPFAGALPKDVVMLWDRGRHYGDGMEWSDSPAAVAYEVTQVPTVFLLDRERRVKDVARGEDRIEALEPAIVELLGRE